MSYQDKYLKYANFKEISQEEVFYKKYLLYKAKYLELKKISEGTEINEQLKVNEQNAGGEKLFNMIFIGPPGGGKGTEIQLLQQMGYYKVSTGDLLRDEVNKGSKLGLSIKKDMDSGNLIKDSIVNKLLNEKIKERNNGLIFDGYPRNVKQAKKLDSILKKNKIQLDVVFHLQTSDKVIISRIAGRYICKKCGASYNKNGVQPKKEGICDVCGGKEFKVRDDDKISVVKKRLGEYHEIEKELLGYYSKKKLVHVVSGEEGDQQLTHQEVLDVFNKL